MNLPRAPGAHKAADIQVFDACQVGVVLRAVPLVQVILAVVSLFGPKDAAAWLATSVAADAIGCALVLALQWRVRTLVPAAQSARLALPQARIRPHFLFNSLNSAIAIARMEVPL